MAQSVTIYDCTLTNVEGNYYNHLFIGESGIQKLFDESCPSALYDSRERSPPPRCLEGTRVTILEEMGSWICSRDGRILWLSGPAGSGKSAIAQTVAEACEISGILACTFFFFRGAQGRDKSNHFVPTISSQLVSRFPEKRAELGQFIENNPFILHKPMDVQFQNLVLPFFATPSSIFNPIADSRVPFVIIIDGLDECAGEKDQQEIVRCIGQLVDACVAPIRVIIVSRPEPHIAESFDRLCSPVHYKSLDRPGNKDYVRETHQNICTYLRREFDRIYREHDLQEAEYWPNDYCVQQLAQASSTGIFIYASTVIKYVDDHDFYPVERLNEILNNKSSSGLSPFSDLDALYKRILGAHKNWKLLRRVLTVVLVGYTGGLHRTLTGEDLADFLLIEKGKVTAALRCMHSILDPKTLKFYHTSFRDFIHDEERAGQYYIDEKEGHVSMTRLILEHIPRGIIDSKVYKYSVGYLEQHLGETGCWDENPDLLYAMAKMLGSTGAKDICFGYLEESVDLLKWFEIRNIMPTSSQPDPLDLRYTLFTLWWEQADSDEFQIYPVYEDCPWSEVFYLERTKNSLVKSLKVLIPVDFGHKNIQKTLLEDGVAKSEFLLPPLRNLIARRIRENHRLDDRKIVEGHTAIIYDWLTEIFESELSCEFYLTQHSYRNKYWTAHLSQVPVGSTLLLDVFWDKKPSDLIGKLTTNEFESLREWLKASKLKIQEHSLLTEEEWFEKLYSGKDGIDFFKGMSQESFQKCFQLYLNGYFWGQWCGPEMI